MTLPHERDVEGPVRLGVDAEPAPSGAIRATSLSRGLRPCGNAAPPARRRHRRQARIRTAPPRVVRLDAPGRRHDPRGAEHAAARPRPTPRCSSTPRPDPAGPRSLVGNTNTAPRREDSTRKSLPRNRPSPGTEVPGRRIGHGTMPRMRILHLVGRSQRRGAELVALELAPALDRLGHTNTCSRCVRGSTAPRRPTCLRSSAAPGWIRSSSHRRARGSCARHLRARTRRRRARARRLGGAGSRTRAPAPAPRRVATHPRSRPDIRRPARRLWWRVVVRRIDAAVALTPTMDQELRDLGFTGPVWTIGNFRDPERFVAVDRDQAARDPAAPTSQSTPTSRCSVSSGT